VDKCIFIQERLNAHLVSSIPTSTQNAARRNPKALTAQEVYRFLREAAAQRQLAQSKAGGEVLPALVDAIRDEALLNLLLYTGLRVSECAVLRVDDVMLNGITYHISPLPPL